MKPLLVGLLLLAGCAIFEAPAPDQFSRDCFALLSDNLKEVCRSRVEAQLAAIPTDEDDPTIEYTGALLTTATAPPTASSYVYPVDDDPVLDHLDFLMLNSIMNEPIYEFRTRSSPIVPLPGYHQYNFPNRTVTCYQPMSLTPTTNCF